jgi:SSS family transporter
MVLIDWVIMLTTLFSIAAYGIWKTRAVKTSESYLRGDSDLKWWIIGLNIMSTQASAITFLSTPGQAYEDGMRFVQFYFGLPIAMIILSIFVIPNYYRLKVYTAYEFLESRFGLPTRALTAILFLIQRGLAAGLTIYAPSIILSHILGWPLNGTILFIGAIVIFYTVSGGTKAVSVTQTQQMGVIFLGLILAAGLIIYNLPDHINFGDAVTLAGKMGKLNVVDFKFDLSNRYTFWSGILGGVFLFLSYFGADQSQVSRYLGGRSLTESRLGLLLNGILKIPLQFVILFVGVLVFVFYQFTQPPLHFNQTNVDKLVKTEAAAEFRGLEKEYAVLFQERRHEVENLMQAIRKKDEKAIVEAQTRVKAIAERDKQAREQVKTLITKNVAGASSKDTDYVFISYVLKYMPIGIVGLLLAMIFAAASSSTSSELNALSTTTVVDLYRRIFVQNASDRHYLLASKGFTILWGVIALSFAITARLFDNLIQAVNIIGSIFYGVILGIFLTAFFLKKVQGRAVFTAAIIAESLVIYIYFQDIVAFLWLNLIGCALVMALALVLQAIFRDEKKVEAA